MNEFNLALKSTLNGKKILIIGVLFYHYNEAIFDKLKQYGAEVTFFNEKDTSFKAGVLKNLSKMLGDKMQQSHYRSILEKVKNTQFNYLLVIRGYKMEPWFISALKKRLPNMTTIMYQWDSYKNWECDYRSLISSFDVVKTFDPKDAKELNLEYVPTFHTDDFLKLKEEKIVYDLFYSGGYSYPRYTLLQDLIKYCENNGITIKTYMAISLIYFLKEQLKGKNLDPSLLKFKTLSKEGYLELFKKSLIIVDYTHAAQTGITMRTFDALAAGKKVLTTNEYIKNEKEYDAEQINTFIPGSIQIDPNFLVPKTFAPKDFSLDRWVGSIFK
jgi:hypothetical protein